MPTGIYPTTTDGHSSTIVQLKGHNSRAAACRLTNDSRAVSIPLKMIIPSLIPWVK
jgi:hypothetical protein